MLKHFLRGIGRATSRRSAHGRRIDNGGPTTVGALRIGAARLFDRVFGASVTFGLIAGWYSSWPTWVMVLLMIVGLVLFLPPVRRPLRMRRERRTQKRYWNGRSGHESPAVAIGLCRAGRLPTMLTYTFRQDGSGRDIDFALPTGIVAADVQAAVPQLVDFYRAVSAEVQQLGPGFVRLALMDSDPLAARRSPTWASDDDRQDEGTEDLHSDDATTPWWVDAEQPHRDDDEVA